MIELSSALLADSWFYGKSIVRQYEAGLCEASRRVSTHGAEKNIALQAHGRMGECALCLYLLLDPYDALDWESGPDQGFDLTYRGFRIDVKTTGPTGRYLIWPVGKNHIFSSKPFDVLALMCGAYRFWRPAGWIDKAGFAEKKQIADGSGKLTRLTCFVPAADLYPMESLLRREAA